MFQKETDEREAGNGLAQEDLIEEGEEQEEQEEQDLVEQQKVVGVPSSSKMAWLSAGRWAV
jgi:hypothetical protein